MNIVKTPDPLQRSEQAVLRLLGRRFAGWSPAAATAHHGHATTVRAWLTSTGRVFLKHHVQRRKYVQEKQAYLQWSPWVQTPRLLDYDDDARILLLFGAPGLSGAADELPIDAHRAAGRWLRALHSIEAHDDDPVPWLDALAQRVTALEARARSTVEPDVIQATLRPVRAVLRSARPVRRVPCHRDFDPRNWLYDGRRLTVVDFEHARLDAPAWDITRLATVVWTTRPDLRAAFVDGYGPERADLWAWVEALAQMDGLSTLVWGLINGDPAFVARGRRALKLG